MKLVLPVTLVLSPALFAQGGPPPAGGPLPPVPVPANNPVTFAKTKLGQALFWEEQMSSTRTVACGTCHVFSAGGSDPRSLASDPAAIHPGSDGVFGTADDVVGSPGVPSTLVDGTYVDEPSFGLDPQVTRRKSPTVVNAAFVPQQFWDGRSTAPFLDPETGVLVSGGPSALESQAAEPPVSATEMAHSSEGWAAIAARIEGVAPLGLAEDVPPDLAAFVGGRSYPELFVDAFGSPDVTPVRIVQAIATYERTLTSDQTPFDQFLAIGPTALTPQQNQGLQIFNGPGRCNICHTGPLFSDMGFHAIGVRPPFEDTGRMEVTGNAADRGRFKTPHLRNVGLRGPYFHTGRFETLAEVVAFYDRGGDFAGNQDPAIVPLGLTAQQQAALVAFLEGGLTDPRVAAETGPFQRPTLYTESNRVPTSFGTGTPGTGGATPRLLALEPPAIGNEDFTLAVDGLFGGAPTLFASDVALVPGGFQAFGATIYLGLSPALSVVPVGLAAGTGPGAGHASLNVPLPGDPTLAGSQFFVQGFAFDGGAPGGLAASQAVRLVLF